MQGHGRRRSESAAQPSVASPNAEQPEAASHSRDRGAKAQPEASDKSEGSALRFLDPLGVFERVSDVFSRHRWPSDSGSQGAKASGSQDHAASSSASQPDRSAQPFAASELGMMIHTSIRQQHGAGRLKYLMELSDLSGGSKALQSFQLSLRRMLTYALWEAVRTFAGGKREEEGGGHNQGPEKILQLLCMALMARIASGTDCTNMSMHQATVRLLLKRFQACWPAVTCFVCKSCLRRKPSCNTQ